MPATEQTWRDSKLLHKIFAVSGVVLLGATLIMLYVDHARSWKPFQRNRTQIDLKMTQWREQQFETEQAAARHAEMQEALATARLAVPDLAPFEAEVEREAKLRKAPPYDFSRVQTLHSELAQAVGEAQAQVKVRNAARETAAATEKAAAAAEAAVKKARAEFGKAKSRAEGQAAIDAATKAAAEAQKAALQARDTLRQEEQKLAEAESLVAKRRQALFDSLKAIVASARVREDGLLGDRKFKNANLDAVKANLGLMVRDNRPEDELVLGQAEIDKNQRAVYELTLEYEAASAHRKELQKILAVMTAGEDDAKKKLDDSQAEFTQLKKTYHDLEPTWFTSEYPGLGKKWLTLPILTAFNSPEKIEQVWLPELTQDFNFKRIARFDRCITCHQAIQKTLPGSATAPAFVKEHHIQLTLAVPAADQLPPHEKDSAGNELPYTLFQLYGIEVAPVGLLSPNAATVSLVEPQSRAAKAELVPGPEITQYDRPGLAVGDVIELIDEDLVSRPAEVQNLLTRSDRWGQPVRLTVRRGLPNPYISHPKLDLYVGDLSPHKMMTFGCTICHEGQDSGTAFKYASHSPNDGEQSKQWSDKYGWFDNHDWRTPMYPERFIESGCIKCHHEVVELRPSERFPEPPAAKLVHGYDLIRKYGCYGCHEINGYDGPKRRVGPDLRLEPNYFAYGLEIAFEMEQWKGDLKEVKAAAQLKGEVDHAIAGARSVGAHPDDRTLRDEVLKQFQMLSTNLKDAGAALPDKITSQLNGLKEVEAAGNMRKPGPSLRYVKSKLDPAFMADWIYNPKHFRPTTRMPQFFGLYSHLQESPEGLEKAKRLEPIEVLGILEFLRTQSQPYEYQAAPGDIAESTHEEKVARGKMLFETRGCLACHNHKDFPEAAAQRPPGEIVQGPDLSGLGAKFAAARNPNGGKWLYSWIRQPSRYHARTVMPDLFLEPIKGADGKLVDPAADIVEFLLSVPDDWKPAPEAITALDDSSRKALNELSQEHLEKAFHKRVAKQYLEQGIPESERKGLKGAEVELVGELTAENADHKKLLYIGRKAISKYGCYGCHDIPTFEDAKPIGTGLADWGRKDASRLAFEHITHYVEHQKDEGHGAAAAAPVAAGAEGASHAEGAPHAATAPHEEIAAEDREFFEHHLEHGDRTGFLYQKLKEPRSYDYKTVENKPYNDRLRMPQFPFTHADREAIMTFVLGLSADPPGPKYVYTPTGRQKAIVEGEQVLEKFNCAACHMLELEQWKITYEPGQFKGKRTVGEAPAPNGLYPYVEAQFTSDELAQKTKFDLQRGTMQATIKGLPVLNAKALPDVVDEAGEALEPEDFKTADPAKIQQRVELWEPLVLGTQMEVQDGANTHTTLEPVVHQPGVQAFLVPGKIVESHRPPRGGFLARYLVKPAFELEKKDNPQANAGQVWGWLPPPLVGEGRKVQAAWLHDFLLDPHPIRPAVFLRMPKFNMSSNDATKLVNYFAAVDNAEYPYVKNEEVRPERLAAEEKAYEDRLAQMAKEGKQDPASMLPHGTRFDDTMRMVVSKNYCVQCHHVGDFHPDGRGRPQGGPDLAQVSRRLRPDYVRRWIANPKQILPYTPMPQNVPYDPTKPYLGAKTQEYHGDSIEQVEALTDFLMNYDAYSRSRSQVKPLVEASKAEAPAGEAPKEGAEPPKAGAAGAPGNNPAPGANPAPGTSVPPTTTRPPAPGVPPAAEPENK